jgi:hypothetical protein
MAEKTISDPSQHFVQTKNTYNSNLVRSTELQNLLEPRDNSSLVYTRMTTKPNERQFMLSLKSEIQQLQQENDTLRQTVASLMEQVEQVELDKVSLSEMS